MSSARVSRPQRSLMALRSLVQFDLARVGGEVADAVKLTQRAEGMVDDLTEHSETAGAELRALSLRPAVNPALILAMRGLFRSECSLLQQSQTQLASAQRREESARSKLGVLRNRERSLDEALLIERRKLESKCQSREVIEADDLWLHRLWSDRR